MDDSQTQTLSIPSLLAFAVVSFFAIRFFFFSTPSGSTQAFPGSSRSGRRVRGRNFPPDRVDTVASMFPQLSRRDIEWDLVNNGGSVPATTERVLTGGRLPAVGFGHCMSLHYSYTARSATKGLNIWTDSNPLGATELHDCLRSSYIRIW